MDNSLQRANIIAKKMNAITKKLTENLDIADSMNVVGDDIVDMLKDKSRTMTTTPMANIDLNVMLSDFTYVRTVLKENTDAARQLLQQVSSTMMDEDALDSGNLNAGMIQAFSELNKSITENMKLFVSSYKEISVVINNINKSKAFAVSAPDQDESADALSPADIIKQLRGE